MKTKAFEIWIEGHRATGDSSTARWIATVEAPTFREACVKFSRTKFAKGFGSFDERHLSFWGCKLFDNGDDAQKSFG